MIVEKFVEIRDAGTKIPALAFQIQPASPAEFALMRSVGYPKETKELFALVFLMKLDGLETQYDAHHWASRAMRYTHLALTDRIYSVIRNPDVPDSDKLNAPIRARCDTCTFENLASGDVVDVEWLMGITNEKKIAEALACPICLGRRVLMSEIGQRDSSTVCGACRGTGRKVMVSMLEESPPCVPLAPRKKKKGGR